MKGIKAYFAANGGRNLLLLTLAGIVNAFGVTVFLMPLQLYDSGISGTSMLLANITPAGLSLSVFLIVLNVPVLLYGLKKNGAAFTFQAIYAVAVYSLCSTLWMKWLNITVPGSSPLAGDDLLLCALFGGLISGIGSGLALRGGGAMDGIEVLAVIFAKGLGITVGTFVMGYNIVLYIICGLVLQSWRLPLYSIVAYAVALKAVDFIVEGIDRSKCAMIVTDKPDAVCGMLSKVFHCGSTRVEARGGYSGAPKTIVYLVVNRFQITRLRKLVHELDPAAYITINDVADVFKATNAHFGGEE